MSLLGSVIFNTFFGRKAPLVRLLDTATSGANASSYTFSNCNLGGGIGGNPTITGDTMSLTTSTMPYVRSSSRKFIVVCVHGEDTAVTFDVTGVTLGGVAGTEIVDRGGGTNFINTSIYAWDTASIASISSTDIAVTWSEGITSCGIGVLEVSNVAMMLTHSSTNNNTGTAAFTGTIGGLTTGIMSMYPCVIVASTSLDDTQRHAVLDLHTNSLGGHMPFDMLYNSRISTEADMAAWWTWAPGAPVPITGEGSTNIASWTVDWTGTSARDAVGAAFL